MVTKVADGEIFKISLDYQASKDAIMFYCQGKPKRFGVLFQSEGDSGKEIMTLLEKKGMLNRTPPHEKLNGVRVEIIFHI